jgi:hypothetical protein
MALNNAQRGIALGAAALVGLSLIGEQKISERALLLATVLVIAILLILAFATPEDEPLVRSPELERPRIGFVHPG